MPTERDRMGDNFEAHVTRDVVAKGEVVIPAGSPVEVKLVESPERADAATLRLSKINLDGDMRTVSADVAKADSDESGLGTAEKTAVGAAAGAVVGVVTGAGVLEGAIVGAGGGLATQLSFSLEEDLEL